MLPSDLAGGVTSVLTDINVDPAVIERITKVIQSSGDRLSTPMGDTNSAPMEGCTGGATFAHHADLAKDHVTQAMADMVTGLTGLDKVVREYNDVQQGNDAEVTAAGYKLRSRLDASGNCFTPPTDTAPAVCSPSDALGGEN